MGLGAEFFGYDFEEEDKRAGDLLDDPQFVESINRTMLINIEADGRREFMQEILDHARELENFADEIEAKLDHDDFRLQFTDKLAQATKGFKASGEATFDGTHVFSLVDIILYEEAKRFFDDSLTPEVMEHMFASMLYIDHKVRFSDFQMDINIKGQGLLPDTYQMTLRFRPIPKRVRK